MLKIYDQNYKYVGTISEYTDLCIEKKLEDGDKTLSFTLGSNDLSDLKNEYYIETEEDIFVVKNIDISSSGLPDIDCQLNLEELESYEHESFSAVNQKLIDAARLAVVSTGWTIETDVSGTKLRSVATLKATPYDVLLKIKDAWMCEIQFDSKNKVVKFSDQFGDDKGVYFTRQLNLKSIKCTTDSYDFYTRLIPIGADDLRIDNDGKDYVENYQYSTKVRTLIWEDTSYTDAAALKEDAIAKLEDLSKPVKSYDADVVDLAKMSERFTVTEYGIGDTITLVDEPTGIKEKQRIVKIKEYPQDPTKNSCELSNTMLTWEEQQAKIKKATDAFEDISNSDGTVNGVYVKGVEADGIVGIEVTISNNETVKAAKSTAESASSTATSAKASADSALSKVGTLEASYADLTEVVAKKATIDDLNAVSAKVGTIEGNFADFKSVTTDEFSAQKALIDDLDTKKLDAEQADLKYANIDFSNIGQAAMEYFYSKSGLIENVVVGEATITGDLVGVTISGDLIKGNTIVAEKLVIKGTDGLYYKLNTDGMTTEAEQTDENSLNGSLIQAKTITASKITVDDLVAFGATIGGYNIKDHALYSGVKSSPTNTTRGVYMDDDGQFAVGDASNYLRFFKDTDGTYKLEISAASMSMSSTGKTVEETITDIQKDIDDVRDEVTTMLYIDSSKGNVFKNDQFSTVLSVILYHGNKRITTSAEMKEIFGSSAKLQWSWQDIDDDAFGIMDPTDSRFSDDGFKLTLSAGDVDVKVTFMCELII